MPDIEPVRELEPDREVLDQVVSETAHFLAFLDSSVGKTRIDPVTGKILDENVQKAVPKDLNTDMVGRYIQLLGEFTERNETFLNQIKGEDGILDASLVSGCIVATYDSRKKTPQHVSESMGGEGSRGSHHSPSKEFLGLIFVDINPDYRKDGVSPSVSAVHELHHQMLAMSDYVFGLDPRNIMQTGVRGTGNSALFGKGHSGERISGTAAFEVDRPVYEKLLGRKDAEWRRAVILQLHYLNELHSSFLQRKSSWLHADKAVYSIFASGKHYEIVGTNLADKEATREMLATLQAVFIFERDAKTAILRVLSDRDREASYLPNLLADFDATAAQIAGLIGVSRTVQQAERLTSQEWKKFKQKYQEFFTKNSSNWEVSLQTFEQVQANAPSLRDRFLK